MNGSLVGRPDTLSHGKKKKRKKNINSILCTQSPASQPPYFSLCSTWEGQTSTDWIWFICARIIWTLFKIFFWWPANVTPTLRMSLEVQTEADVRLMLPQAIKQSFTTYYSIYLSIFPSTHNMHVKDKRAFAKKSQKLVATYRHISQYNMTA